MNLKTVIPFRETLFDHFLNQPGARPSLNFSNRRLTMAKARDTKKEAKKKATKTLKEKKKEKREKKQIETQNE